jgi:hypothetical protein
LAVGTYHGATARVGRIRRLAHCANYQKGRNVAVRWLNLYAGIFVVALASLAGCERSAPGPAACGELAKRWVALGVRNTPVVSSAAVASSVDEIARLCVTTPFDREVIRCAEAGGGPTRCLQAFEDRRRR